MNYWMILFRATSFVDFLTRLDFVNGIMQSDQRIMDDLKALQAEIADKQIQLEGERRELETANQALLEKETELDAQREAANQLTAAVLRTRPPTTPPRVRAPVGHKKRKSSCCYSFFFGAPNRARTCDTAVNSRVLYRLSY